MIVCFTTMNKINSHLLTDLDHLVLATLVMESVDGFIVSFIICIPFSHHSHTRFFFVDATREKRG